MTDRLPALLLVAAAVAAALGGRDGTAPKVPTPAVRPDCPDDRCPVPSPRPRPWGDGEAPTGAYVGGEESKDGVPVQVRVPREWHVKNRGGSDGAGLCVYASCRHTGLVQGDPVFAGMFEWMFRRPGGSYPTKLAQSIAAYAKEKGLVAPRFLQVERAGDFGLLKKACASGRPPGVTLSLDPAGRYRGKIAHMVSMTHCDDARVAILDNNFPGTYEWMTPDEARRAGVLDWNVFLLSPGAPPVPRSD